MTFYSGQFLDDFFLLLFLVLLILRIPPCITVTNKQIWNGRRLLACPACCLCVCGLPILSVCVPGVPSVCRATTTTAFCCDLSAVNGLSLSAAPAAIRSFISIRLHRLPPANLLHCHSSHLERGDTDAPAFIFCRRPEKRDVGSDWVQNIPSSSSLQIKHFMASESHLCPSSSVNFGPVSHSIE